MKKIFGCIIGHNPLLSMAEVLSVFKYSCRIVAFDREFLIVEVEENIPFFPEDMGGVIKIFEVKAVVSKDKIIPTVGDMVKAYCKERGIEAKLNFTVSVYGAYKKYQKEVLLDLKKTSAAYITGKRRFINKSLEKNAAEALIHTEEIYEKGVEVVSAEKEGVYYLGVGRWAQDIEAYSVRDMEKPHRDSRNGMLPPKLAQTMLSLTRSDKTKVVWDPFCGSGTVLMEGLLQGKKVIGSDANDTMAHHSANNVQWMIEHPYFRAYTAKEYFICQEDVSLIRNLPALHGEFPHVIVTEGYLGRNYRGEYPTREEALRQQQDVMDIWGNFFRFLKTHLEVREIVATFPVHILHNGIFIRCKDVPFIAEENGFEIDPLVPLEFDVERKMRASYTKEGTILYVRGEQYVGREIVRLRRK